MTTSPNDDTSKDTGYIDDSQLPEELRPDSEAEGRADRAVDPAATAGGLEAGRVPEPSARTPEDEPDVSEPTG